MRTDVHNAEVTPPSGPPTVSTVGELAVQHAMRRDWTVEVAGRMLVDAAVGDGDLLRRARVQLLKTNNPQSQVGRRALLALAYAMAATAQRTRPRS